MRASADAVTEQFDAYAITAPGIERVTAAELAALGATVAATEAGGVAFRADHQLLWRANLELRTATRVIVRLGVFRVRALGEMERKTATLPWEHFLARGQPLRLRVTSRKSRLFHTGAVAQRIAAGASARLGAELDHAPAGEDDEPVDSQLIIVRLLRDECMVSVDSSGALLHRRGYRLEGGRAPIRETLAAATLLAIGFDGDQPLLDPLCGSGTIPIEAALIARDIAPGATRDFAFTRWPAFDAERWISLRGARLVQTRPETAAAIGGSDRDAGAIAAARANAERAGVGESVSFRIGAISAAEPSSSATGWLVTNPPYGVRVGDERRLGDLYARLGQVARARFRGWRIAMVSSSPALAAQTGFAWREELRTKTGGLGVRVLSARVG